MAAVNQTARVIDDDPAPATPAARAAASALERYPDGVIEDVSPRDHMFRVRRALSARGAEGARLHPAGHGRGGKDHGGERP